MTLGRGRGKEGRGRREEGMSIRYNREYGKPARKPNAKCQMPNAKDGSLAIFNMLNAKDYITDSRIRTTIC